jgi:ribosomal-protein-alanine N-acetyltransferase
MDLRFAPMDEASARAILEWRYAAPLDVYNPDPARLEENVAYFVNPDNRLYRMTDDSGELVAYCSVGADAQVPGGDYQVPALDLGLGLRPDLTGQGRGAGAVCAVLAFAAQAFDPPRFRVSVAAFNTRALRVWEKAGFGPVQRFGRSSDGMPFVILIRGAGAERD